MTDAMIQEASAMRQLLLIEDDPGDARLLKEMLIEAGSEYSVEWAGSLAAAAECDRPEGWDLILVDLGLPDSFGVSTFFEVESRWPDVPIVVLSGLLDHSTAKEAVRAGAQDYLPKGEISAKDITRALNYAIERHHSAAERKSLIQELEQSRKLEAIGQLAAGVAHEINTPTQYVSDNARFLRDAVGSLVKALNGVKACVEEGGNASAADIERLFEETDLQYLLDELPQAVDQSLEGLDHISRIVRAMKDFSHPASGEKTPTDLHRALDTTLLVASSEWKYVADVEKRYAPNLTLVECLPGEINQVFLNLLVNAAHAIGDVVEGSPGTKGLITIETKEIDKQWVEVRIQDTGTGIAPEHRAKLFEQFFTTKGVGKGTGQGLAIARNVVAKKHGGTITFETCEGEGTIFVVRLPVRELGEEPDERR